MTEEQRDVLFRAAEAEYFYAEVKAGAGTSGNDGARVWDKALHTVIDESFR